MRIIFLGSGEFGLPTLQHLTKRQQVVAVISQPDRPAGRRRRLMPTPIAHWAQSSGLVVHKSHNANDPAFVAQIAALKADAAVVVAFGQKLGTELIAALGRLAVNLHASLLPEYRGAAPINWAILHGRSETGLTVISIAQRMDAGLIYAQARAPINPLETTGELHDHLAKMGPHLVDQVLGDFRASTLQGHQQDESQATLAPKLSKADRIVDFNTSPYEVRCRVHGLTPWPGLHVIWLRKANATSQTLCLRRVADEDGATHDQAPGTVLAGQRVAVRGGVVRLLEVQLPGKRSMGIDQFIRGHPIAPGDRFASVRP